MNLSLDEYRALVAKSFRGVSYPWGLTEEAAFAARRLAEFGIGSGEMVVRLLNTMDGIAASDRMPDEPSTKTQTVVCPVCVGAALADQSGCETSELALVAEPVLIAPFLQMCLNDPDAGYHIRWPGGTCEVGMSSIVVAGDLPTEPLRVHINRGDSLAKSTDLAHRVELSEATVDALERFAYRTYAPASEASRAGAGADVTDND